MKLWQKIAKSPPLSLVFRSPWMGIYPSFAAAAVDVPHDGRLSYNHPEAKENFLNYPLDRVRSADYPVLLHLRSLLEPGQRLVDLGGNIGMAYYTALKFYPIPTPFEWILLDVPELIEAARTVAARESHRSEPLRFITDIKEAGACDIFFSSGTVQYLESSLAEILRQLPHLPDSIIVNRVPVWDREPIITLQDIGFVICPYRVFNRTQFESSIAQLGYRIVDTWPCPESTFSVRFHPRLRINAYQGYYFTRV